MQPTTSQTGPRQQHINKFEIRKNLAISFGIAFIAFLFVGIALGVLPGFIRESLGFSNRWVAVVIALHYISSLCTRQYAQRMIERKGSMIVLYNGVLLALFCGACQMFAINVSQLPYASLGLIIAARILMGISESFLVASMFIWVCSLSGPKNTGKVTTITNIGLYAGIACGVLLGILVKSQMGLLTLFSLTAPIPLFILFVMQLIPPLTSQSTITTLSSEFMITRLRPLDMELILVSLAISVLTALITIFLIKNHGVDKILIFICLSGFYVLTRLFLSHEWIKFRCPQLRLFALVCQIMGLCIILWGTPGNLTLLGIGLSGTGLSLFHASLERTIIDKALPHNFGQIVVSFYTFWDLTLIFMMLIIWVVADHLNT